MVKGEVKNRGWPQKWVGGIHDGTKKRSLLVFKGEVIFQPKPANQQKKLKKKRLQRKTASQSGYSDNKGAYRETNTMETLNTMVMGRGGNRRRRIEPYTGVENCAAPGGGGIHRRKNGQPWEKGRGSGRTLEDLRETE